jgi:DNA-binding NtrC family response regulator
MKDAEEPMRSINPPAGPCMQAFLEMRLPGGSAGVQRVRERVLDFALSPTTRSLTIRGPIGGGKSRLARDAALLRRVAPLTAEEAKLILDSVKFMPDGQIDYRSIMSFYRELSLTGLVDSLADAQLFGTVKGAFTGAVDSPGIFERASQGLPDETSVAAAVTGGVVFLDEIADLSRPLQAKLLPVLSGGAFHRVGAEARKNGAQTFSGIVITASWRDLDGQVRPDLLSRISACVIDLPGLDERKEDFPAVVGLLQEGIMGQFRAEIARLRVAEPRLAKEYWQAREEGLVPLDDDAIAKLANVEWRRHGNFRGLRTAVERLVIGGRPVEQVVGELPRTDGGESGEREHDLLANLLERAPDGSSLGVHVRAIELAQRRELQRSLQNDPATLSTLAERLGVESGQLKVQLRDLGRERRIGAGDRS